MNDHQRREAKRARRLKRTTGATRGKTRGPITRGKARAALMNEGERRLVTTAARIGNLGAKYKRERNAGR